VNAAARCRKAELSERFGLLPSRQLVPRGPARFTGRRGDGEVREDENAFFVWRTRRTKTKNISLEGESSVASWWWSRKQREGGKAGSESWGFARYAPTSSGIAANARQLACSNNQDLPAFLLSRARSRWPGGEACSVQRLRERETRASARGAGERETRANARGGRRAGVDRDGDGVAPMHHR